MGCEDTARTPKENHIWSPKQDMLFSFLSFILVAKVRLESTGQSCRFFPDFSVVLDHYALGAMAGKRLARGPADACAKRGDHGT